MKEFQQHFTFVSIVSLTMCVCAKFTQLSDMLLSFLVVSPAALVYKNLRQNILVKAARKTGSQTRQTIRLAREPIDRYTYTDTHTHEQCVAVSMGRRTHTHREREIVDRKVKTKHKQNSFTFIKFAYKYKTYSRNTYIRMCVCVCVCVCAIVLKVKLQNHPQSTQRTIIYVAVCMQCVY